MSRYIDAEWLKGQINTTFWAEIGKIIDNAPSIDIVRCKECKHRYVEETSWGEYNEFCDFWRDGNGYWASVNPDEFCSYGEREGE